MLTTFDPTAYSRATEIPMLSCSAVVTLLLANTPVWMATVYSVKWGAVSTVLLLIAMIIIVFYHVSLMNQRTLTPSQEACNNLELQIAYLQEMMLTNEQKSMETIERMRAQNKETLKLLESKLEFIRILEKRNGDLIKKLQDIQNGGHQKKEIEDRFAPYITPVTTRTLNIHQNSEFEVIPYDSFSRTNMLYQLCPGMVNKPETLAIGDAKKEHNEVVVKAADILNEDSTDSYSTNDLAYGYSRTDKTVGTQYELYFQSKGGKNTFQHIQLFRPFAPLQKVQSQTYNKQGEWINLIMPLSGRTDTFRLFIEMFTEECIKKDKRVFLTVVYFGIPGLNEVKGILREVELKFDFSHYMIVEKPEKFSRGVGLLSGAEAWMEGNVLMFFCDVDVFFTVQFLDHCRLNAALGAKVFYPIVFSLYNPSIVYHTRPNTPTWKEQMVLRRDTGFWRTFGFGMTCMYRSDFMFMRGFDISIQGWGGEDVKLYRKFVQSNYDVVRAPDSGIFHLWHEKFCDPKLSPAQYNMCLGSKALGEASHSQLGMLAFSELKKENERLHQQTNTEDDQQLVHYNYADNNNIEMELMDAF